MSSQRRETPANGAAEKMLLNYLDNPRMVAPDEAVLMLEHAASCSECGERLALKPWHAETLLEATRPSAEPTPNAQDLVAATQREFVIFGDAVLNRIREKGEWKPSFEPIMSADLPVDRRGDLWTLTDVDNSRLRAALAGAETVRALRSFLAGGRRKPIKVTLKTSGLRLNEERTVPAQYFVIRIATYALSSKESADVSIHDGDLWTLARALWNSIAETAIKGRVGLPEIYAFPVAEEEIGLSLAGGSTTANVPPSASRY